MAKARIPVARYQNAKFNVINLFGVQLDLSELLLTLSVGLLGPLFLSTLNLGTTEFIIAVACLWSWPFMLFVVRREQRNTAEWLADLLPFWTRQRVFHRRSSRSAADERTDLIDRSISAGPNLISWEWQIGPDGVRELHLYEDPSLPYRAAIANYRAAVRHRQLESRLGRPVAVTRRPAPVDLP